MNSNEIDYDNIQICGWQSGNTNTLYSDDDLSPHHDNGAKNKKLSAPHNLSSKTIDTSEIFRNKRRKYKINISHEHMNEKRFYLPSAVETKKSYSTFKPEVFAPTFHFDIEVQFKQRDHIKMKSTTKKKNHILPTKVFHLPQLNKMHNNKYNHRKIVPQQDELDEDNEITIKSRPTKRKPPGPVWGFDSLNYASCALKENCNQDVMVKNDYGLIISFHRNSMNQRVEAYANERISPIEKKKSSIIMKPKYIDISKITDVRFSPQCAECKF